MVMTVRSVRNARLAEQTSKMTQIRKDASDGKIEDDCYLE
jgi:hypothetical protein